MTRASPYEWARARLAERRRGRALSTKAVSFALIGVVNTVIDYGVFLVARAALSRSPAAVAFFDSLAHSCDCGNAATISLIAANTMSWIVAVSASYVMNSSITFAAEFGTQARMAVLLYVRHLRRCRMARQHGGPRCRRRGSAPAGLAGEGRGDPRELRGEFLAIALCRVSRARSRRPAAAGRLS